VTCDVGRDPLEQADFPRKFLERSVNPVEAHDCDHVDVVRVDAANPEHFVDGPSGDPAIILLVDEALLLDCCSNPPVPGEGCASGVPIVYAQGDDVVREDSPTGLRQIAAGGLRLSIRTTALGKTLSMIPANIANAPAMRKMRTRNEYPIASSG